MSDMKLVSKLTIKSAGANPKKIHAVPDGVEFLSLCTIVGIADGIKQVEDPNQGKVFFPLTGRFQATNSANGDITRSGILYLPTGIHETYEAAVRKLEEGDSIRFALELRAVKATNPAGYSYEAVDLLPMAEVDPLQEITKTLAASKQTAVAQLAAVSTAPMETPMPAKESAEFHPVATKPATGSAKPAPAKPANVRK
jgi:hypothetical protein